MHTKILAQVNQELQLLCASRNAILTLTQPCESGTKDYQLLLPLTQDDWDNIEDDKFTRPGSTLSFKPNAVRKLGAELTFANRLLTISIKDASAVTVDEQLSAFPIIPTLQQRTGTNTVLHHIKFDTNVSSQEFEEVANGLSQVYGDALGLEPADVCFTNQQSILFSFSVHPVDKCFGENLGGTRDSFSLEQLEQFRRSERQPIKVISGIDRKLAKVEVDLTSFAAKVKKLRAVSKSVSDAAIEKVKAIKDSLISEIKSGWSLPTKVKKLGNRCFVLACVDDSDDVIAAEFNSMLRAIAVRLDTLGNQWNADEVAMNLLSGLMDGIGVELEKVGNYSRDLTSATEVELKYISDFNFDDYPGIKKFNFCSYMGSGKGVLIQRLISKLGTDASIICIDCRVALVNQHANDFGLTHYRRIGDTDFCDVQKLVTTPDSLWQFLLGDYNASRNLVVIDEIDSVLEYAATCTGTKINERRKAVLTVMQLLMMHSDMVVTSSADTGQLDVDFLDYLDASDSKSITIKNTYKPGGKQFITVNTKEEALTLAKHLMKTEKAKIFFPSDSKDVALEIYETFNSEDCKGKVIVKETSEEEMQKFADDAEAYCKGLDFLAASPKIGVGINIDFEYFDYVIGLFTNPKMSYRSCLQSMARVRHPKSGKYYFWENTNVDSRNIAEGWIKDLMRLEELSVAEGLSDVNIYSNVPSQSLRSKRLIDFQFKYIRRRLIETINRKWKMEEAIKHDGHTILTYVAEDGLEAVEKGSAKDWKLRRCDEILEADSLSEREARELNSIRDELKAEDELRLEKYDIAKSLGVKQKDLTLELIQWRKYGIGEKAINVKRLLNMTADDAAQADIENMAKRMGLGGLGSEFNQKKRNALLAVRPFIRELVKEGSYDDSYDFSELLATVEAHVKDFRELGVNRVDWKSPARTVNALLNLFMVPFVRNSSKKGSTVGSRNTSAYDLYPAEPPSPLHEQLQRLKIAPSKLSFNREK